MVVLADFEGGTAGGRLFVADPGLVFSFVFQQEENVVGDLRSIWSRTDSSNEGWFSRSSSTSISVTVSPGARLTVAAAILFRHQMILICSTNARFKAGITGRFS